ncbi:hypothetical protein VNO77_31165 [Canavalia gladiata]|uniref:Uncharacterized protein n=1 Tax=Canavalia gladiata TaxID=3824 RepID=A0AAN9KP07_CANGL
MPPPFLFCLLYSPSSLDELSVWPSFRKLKVKCISMSELYLEPDLQGRVSLSLFNNIRESSLELPPR